MAGWWILLTSWTLLTTSSFATERFAPSGRPTSRTFRCLTPPGLLWRRGSSIFTYTSVNQAPRKPRRLPPADKRLLQADSPLLRQCQTRNRRTTTHPLLTTSFRKRDDRRRRACFQ